MKILTIAQLKVKEILFSKSTFITMLILPLLFVYIIASTYSDENLTNGIPIALVDEDSSEYSRSLISFLKEEKVLKVMEMNLDKAEKMVANNQVEGAYIIKKDFETAIKKDDYPKVEVLKSTGAYGAEAITEIISSGVVRLLSNARAANIIVKEYEGRGLIADRDKEMLWQEVFDKSESYWYPKQLMELDYNSIYYGNETENNQVITGFTEGPIGIVIAFISLSIGFGLSSILKEREEGTLKRLYTIFSSPFPIIIGNVLAMLFTIFIQVILILTTTKYFFQISLGTFLHSIIFILIFYTTLLISMILYLATFDNYSSSIQSIYAGVMIITSMMGGCFWSLDLLPSELQRLAFFTPQGLAMVSLRFANMGDMSRVIVYCSIMFFMTILFIILSRKRLKYYI